jgi:hypothetical protein
MSNKIVDGIIKPIDWLRKTQAGPAPSLDPKVILKDLAKDETINRVRKSEFSLHNAYLGPARDQKKIVTIIQRGLIALDLMAVDRTKKYWWRKPIIDAGIDGGFVWGSYGDQTSEAIKVLQDLAGIDPKEGLEGQKFGFKTLTVLEAALKAKAAKMDWRAAVKKAAIK